MPSAPDHKSTFESLSLPVFCILGAISLAIWWSPLFSTFALALHDDQYTHILLILPVSAALIFMDWKPFEAHSRLSLLTGSVLLVAAAWSAFFMRWRAVSLPTDEQLSANMLALVVWWIAAFILCFGLPASRRALFPLCFLLWLVPLPNFVLNPIVNLLQQGSAAAAHLLFAAAGVPVEQRGVLVHIPGLIVEVARECSSIRSSSMLIVTTMVLAQLLLRSAWRKAFIILVAIPLSVAKNGLRIFTIAMLTTHVDPSFLTGRLHRKGGIIFFMIALAATFLLLWILRRGEEANDGVRATGAVSTEI
ncbi:MAG: exosortase/archaeosortase family protein [Candidatus Sulfotelmatobacter sp.]